MEKMRLTLDELEVQSFTTTRPAGEQRGTVHGHDAPTDEVECPTADVNWNTCWESCVHCGGGNTDDCTVICWTDGDCTTRGSWYYTLC